MLHVERDDFIMISDPVWIHRVPYQQYFSDIALDFRFNPDILFDENSHLSNVFQVDAGDVIFLPIAGRSLNELRRRYPKRGPTSCSIRSKALPSGKPPTSNPAATVKCKTMATTTFPSTRTFFKPSWIAAPRSKKATSIAV